MSLRYQIIEPSRNESVTLELRDNSNNVTVHLCNGDETAGAKVSLQPLERAAYIMNNAESIAHECGGIQHSCQVGELTLASDGNGSIYISLVGFDVEASVNGRRLHIALKAMLESYQQEDAA